MSGIPVITVRSVFTTSDELYLLAASLLRAVPEAGAAGIRQGSEVYFLGTLVGSVSDVLVDTTGRMEAQANIRRDFFRFVRMDSSAVIKKKFGVAGDSFFEITRGEGRPLPEKNASIVCNEQFQSALEAAVEDIRSQAMAVLKKTSTGLDAWTMLGTNLDNTQGRLNQLVADVQAGKGTVGNLLTDPATADELKTLLVKANQSVDGLQVTLNNLQQASTNLPAISDVVGKEAKDLPGLVMQTQVSMREVERLVEAIQRTWLLRKHVNQTNPPPLRPLPEPAVSEQPPGKAFPSPRNSAH
jgi:phospholipid/cholesterol/gamma-HCH transport system substrate-binding protein